MVRASLGISRGGGKNGISPAAAPSDFTYEEQKISSDRHFKSFENRGQESYVPILSVFYF